LGIASLMDDVNLDESQKESIKMISSSGRLLQSIVDDVLDYSKLQSGNAEVDIKKCDIQDVVKELSSMRSSVLARKRNIAIETRFDALVSRYIQTDGRRLLQILFNLTSNAIKYSKTDGVVQIRIFVADKVDDPVEISGNENDDCDAADDAKEVERLPLVKFKRSVLRITVKDFGKGIAKSNFGSIFLPFTQTNAGVRNIEGGTGLGLAITEKLVKALGGDISVDSCLSQWTEFTVDLPYDEPEPPITVHSIASRFAKCDLFFIQTGQPNLYTDDIRKDVEYLETNLEYFGVESVHVSSMKSLESMLLKDQLIAEDERHGIVCLVPATAMDVKLAERLGRQYHMKTAVIGKQSEVDLSSELLFAVKQFCNLGDFIPHVVLSEIAELGSASLESSSTREWMSDDGVSNHKDKNTTGGEEEPSKTRNCCDLTSLRILVAEDNSINQKILARMLQRLNVKDVVMVENGQLAVEAEASQPFDIVLMDMQMPVMDGIESSKLILQRKEGGHPTPLIVFVTAHVSSSFEQECLESGAVAYLPKPYTLPVLEATLLDVGSKLHIT
jgi:CheY-like chemotaxis protein/two-component sensor histidine kinase